LYLYIYIALLEVHTNQKRFQCERPREKRALNPSAVVHSTYVSKQPQFATYQFLHDVVFQFYSSVYISVRNFLCPSYS